MRKLYTILALFLVILLIPHKYEHYSYSSFRWINIANSLFAYQRIWYLDNLILKTNNPDVVIGMALSEDGILAADITVYNGYPSSWCRYYSIGDNKWLSTEDSRSCGGGGGADITTLMEFKQLRDIFEKRLNLFERSIEKSIPAQTRECEALEL